MKHLSCCHQNLKFENLASSVRRLLQRNYLIRVLQQRFITSARFKWKQQQLDWRGRLRRWRKISWNRMMKVIIKWMFTFLSVSKFTCKAISVFSLLGSRVREFKSPPPVLIRPLNKKKKKGAWRKNPRWLESHWHWHIWWRYQSLSLFTLYLWKMYWEFMTRLLHACV